MDEEMGARKDEIGNVQGQARQELSPNLGHPLLHVSVWHPLSVCLARSSISGFCTSCTGDDCALFCQTQSDVRLSVLCHGTVVGESSS